MEFTLRVDEVPGKVQVFAVYISGGKGWDKNVRRFIGEFSIEELEKFKIFPLQLGIKTIWRSADTQERRSG